jgi:hypothetical protein
MGKKRWDRSKYPENWEEISHNFRASKDFRCEFCGYKQGDPLVSKAGNEYKGSVDAAHKYPFDEANPDPELYCLCKSDHRIYDNGWREEIEETEHQARMHDILLNANGYETVYCSHEECQGYFLPHEHP